jgi:transcriptional regulator with XRE-family HTH domain
MIARSCLTVREGLPRVTDHHPAALRRRLTAALRRHRSQAGVTQREVAKNLGWSPSKIIRIEQGDVGISVADLWALLRLYKIDQPEIVNELEEMARGSKRLPFSDYADVLSQETLKYIRYEASSSLIRQVALTVIPGLLQTDAYIESLFASRQMADSRIAKMLASRRDRRGVFEGEDPPETFFIIDEGALRRVVGGTDVMGEQLDHLAKMAERARIKIQVLPFGAGAHPAMSGGFNLLEFANDDDPDVLFFESPLEDILYRDEPEVTAQFRLRFWELEDLSTEISDFQRFLAPG